MTATGIGLGTYSFYWQWHPSAQSPLSVAEMVDRTASRDVRRFQICDYPPIEDYDDAALQSLRRHARACGVELELGTRGVRPRHLARYLRIAEALGVTLVRTMIPAAGRRAAAAEVVAQLREIMPDYERAGVTLALETYEQIPVRDLVAVVEAAGSASLGICLDPANCVAALENPRKTAERTAPYVRNVHIKDFVFTRQDGWVGFSLTGAPLGEGLLDYRHLVRTVRPQDRGISQIVEHWLPWQGDSATTIRTEDEWTLHSLDYLRSVTA